MSRRRKYEKGIKINSKNEQFTYYQPTIPSPSFKTIRNKSKKINQDHSKIQSMRNTLDNLFDDMTPSISRYKPQEQIDIIKENIYSQQQTQNINCQQQQQQSNNIEHTHINQGQYNNRLTELTIRLHQIEAKQNQKERKKKLNYTQRITNINNNNKINGIYKNKNLNNYNLSSISMIIPAKYKNKNNYQKRSQTLPLQYNQYNKKNNIKQKSLNIIKSVKWHFKAEEKCKQNIAHLFQQTNSFNRNWKSQRKTTNTNIYTIIKEYPNIHRGAITSIVPTNQQAIAWLTTSKDYWVIQSAKQENKLYRHRKASQTVMQLNNTVFSGGKDSYLRCEHYAIRFESTISQLHPIDSSSLLVHTYDNLCNFDVEYRIQKKMVSLRQSEVTNTIRTNDGAFYLGTKRQLYALDFRSSNSLIKVQSSKINVQHWMCQNRQSLHFTQDEKLCWKWGYFKIKGNYQHSIWNNNGHLLVLNKENAINKFDDRNGKQTELISQCSSINSNPTDRACLITIADPYLAIATIEGSIIVRHYL